MDFKDQVRQLGGRVLSMRERVETEEATKNAFIMPFIQLLGFDVFDPSEIVPEFTCDVGTKKGEKIDYAICFDGTPTILVECKHWGQNLANHVGQLTRYFTVSKARFGILTNGIVYKFYSDLDEPNKMDETPFLEFDITSITDAQTEELKKFHKSYFNLDEILTTATELKFTGAIKALKPRQVAEIDQNGCIGCTICAKNCKFGAIEGSLKQPHKVNAACTGCGVCAAKCPKKVITMKDAVAPRDPKAAVEAAPAKPAAETAKA